MHVVETLGELVASSSIPEVTGPIFTDPLLKGLELLGGKDNNRASRTWFQFCDGVSEFQLQGPHWDGHLPSSDFFQKCLFKLATPFKNNIWIQPMKLQVTLVSSNCYLPFLSIYRAGLLTWVNKADNMLLTLAGPGAWKLWVGVLALAWLSPYGGVYTSGLSCYALNLVLL